MADLRLNIKHVFVSIVQLHMNFSIPHSHVSTSPLAQRVAFLQHFVPEPR